MKNVFIPMRWFGQCAVVAAFCGFVATAHATLYAYNGYAIVNNSSGGNVYYDLDTPTANPDFVGNTFTVNYGGSLLLGAQVSTDPGGGMPSSWGADWARIFYSIDGGSYTSINLPVNTSPTGDWFERFEEAGAGMVNIATGLSQGSHTLTIYLQAHDNTQPADGYVSNGGLNFTANISVVPEPANLAMGVFGGLILAAVALRHYRKPQDVQQLA